MRKECMHIPSNFTSIYLHRKLPFCSMAKGNGPYYVPLKGEKEGKKQRRVVQQGVVWEYAPTNLHIALRPLNVTQKTMDSTVMLVSGTSTY